MCVIPYAARKKIAESFIYIIIYNKFIIRKKLNPNDPKDNLKFCTLLIEEILLFSEFGCSSNSAGPSNNQIKHDEVQVEIKHDETS